MLTVTYTECHLCWLSLMLRVTYDECHLCWESPMMSVTYPESHLWWVSLILSVTYADCHLRWVSHISPLCWVSLCWVSWCWVSWHLCYFCTKIIILWQLFIIIPVEQRTSTGTRILQNSLQNELLLSAFPLNYCHQFHPSLIFAGSVRNLCKMGTSKKGPGSKKATMGLYYKTFTAVINGFS